ncbi:H+/Ca2+ exchanger [Emiliania huxleyi CCMP1516]|uniref:Sodium/calcium exchanger membrane region domain-containing protein n=2 Tax=Emiliania huxleyi TaxID=2903 RepID=A0A0D3KUG9_EMIH1|nr:H+/Ca2+ exchanger [Emiliania huxleyi CCMP1516]EOD39404.1 H+/Ca2+ exchanger [Emiliania huxleyi CCMP1516]|eukprot:XP_005791833.1 H+/Ca2+ exchanger [Emiliania huxleyi CCMP1516]
MRRRTKSAAHAALHVLFGSRLNLLLPCGPAALLAARLGIGDEISFLLALAALCPLAERIGYATEQAALHTSSQAGALLNATFGNATELIVSLCAIREGLLRVVQLSLLGSVLSNLLLVLGCAFFFGGVRHATQRYDQKSAEAHAAVLVLGAVTMVVPDVLGEGETKSSRHEDTESDVLSLSRWVSVVLLFSYASLIAFELGISPAPPEISPPLSPSPEEEEVEEEEEEELSFRQSTVALALLCAATAGLSEVVVGSIQGAAAGAKVPLAFVSTILLPIVGNAAEHASAALDAVALAARNKPDLAIGVAVGSATQITLLGFPASVLAAWAYGEPLSLDMLPFETACLVLTILGVATVLPSGRSNWLKGLTLISLYVVIALAFLFHDSSETRAPAAAKHKRLG